MTNMEDIIGVSSTKSKVEVEDLVKHLNGAHDQNLTYEKIRFDRQETFIKWFTNVQTDTPRRQFRKRTTNTTDTIYYCVSSPKSVSKATCPAHVVATRCPDDQIDVKYVSKHYCDSSEKSDHLQKCKSDQNWIAEKLLNQIPIEVVLQNIQTNFRKRKEPFFVVKNGGTMPQTLNQNQLHSLTAIDSSSSTEYVSLYEINDYSPIILYKRQGMNTFDISPHGLEISGCDVDEFLFVMMDAHQCETLMLHGSGDTSMICIDSTIDQIPLNGFHLSVVLVRDEGKRAFPVAYMYSNRNTESTFTLFFHAIRSRTGIVCCNAFISDMSMVFYNAWNIIMGGSPHHLYSAWQVDESFKVNTKLYIINDNKLVSYVYKKLRALLDEEDVGRLEKSVSNLIWKLAENPSTTIFGEFFEKHYVSSIESWACCYRARYNVGTNNHLERMHNVFKNIYLKGMKNFGLDVAICSLLNVVYDEEFYRMTSLRAEKSIEASDDRATSPDVNDKTDCNSADAFGEKSDLSSIDRGYHDTAKQLTDEVALLIETVSDREQILSVIDTLQGLKQKQDHTTSGYSSSTGIDSRIELINKSDANSDVRNRSCTIHDPLGVNSELLSVQKQNPAEIELELSCFCE